MIHTDGTPTIATAPPGDQRPDALEIEMELVRMEREKCIDCRGAVAPALSRLGSTRCHDCRGGVL